DLVLPGGTTLEVHVTLGDSGRPCAGAHVRVSCALPDSRAELWSAEGTTALEGTITFHGLPADGAQVEARSAQGYGVRAITTDGSTEATCRVELLATGRITGTVIDAQTNQPLAGARVGAPSFGVQ